MSEEDDVTKVKVVFVGEAFTGKTAIIQRVIYDTYEDNMVTTMVASNYSKVIDFEGNHSIRFEIWDTAGQEKYRSINKIFYKDAAIVIMVYDISNRRTFEEIKNYWHPEIVKKNSKVIFALVGTFADVKDETKSVSEEEIKEFMTKTGILYEYKISSMNYENIKDVFNKIGECLLSIKQ